MDLGYRPVKRIATPATNVSGTAANHSSTTTMWCGMARNHLTNHNQRLSPGSRRASSRTGYAPGTDSAGRTSAPAPGVVGDRRTAITANASPPANSSSPSALRMKPIGSSSPVFEPTEMSTATPGLAFAFMTTKVQSPRSLIHVRLCWAVLEADALQNFSLPGTVADPLPYTISVRELTGPQAS